MISSSVGTCSCLCLQAIWIFDVIFVLRCLLIKHKEVVSLRVDGDANCYNRNFLALRNFVGKNSTTISVFCSFCFFYCIRFLFELFKRKRPLAPTKNVGVLQPDEEEILTFRDF